MHCCFESYYEGVLQIEGARGRPIPAAFKRKLLEEPDDADSQPVVAAETGGDDDPAATDPKAGADRGSGASPGCRGGGQTPCQEAICKEIVQEILINLLLLELVCVLAY